MWYAIASCYTVSSSKVCYSENILLFSNCCTILLSVLYKCIELFDLQLRLLGSHQLQNAVTATCAALCLREQGVEKVLASQY